MVTVVTHYECSKCGSPHRSFDAAEACETRHIVLGATDGFSRDLKKILRRRASSKIGGGNG
jgi:hypothetical protein